MKEKEVINYKPFSDRTSDHQYKNLLREVMDEGEKFIPIHARLPENSHLKHQGSLDISGYMLKYNLSNGFPLEPIRDLKGGFYGALAEICAFLNGIHTQADLIKFGVPKFFWGPTVTEEKCKIFRLETGDLGPGSYGEVLRKIPVDEGYFDQVLALENAARDTPYIRTLVLSTWYPPYSMGDSKQGFPRKVVVAPCHGNFTRFKLNDQTRKMHMITVPRSSDAPVGLVFNIAQWCAVGMMLADLLDYEFTKYVMMVTDPQIYDIQFDSVNELLQREPRRLPSVYLRPKEKRNHLWEYRPEDFILEDYDPHTGMKIPVTV